MNESRRSAPETKWRPLLETMVDELAASGALRSAAIRRSFVEIPRHLFVDRSWLEEIYSDAPIVTKTDPEGRPVSSSSMPSLIANMLEDLDLRPGLRVMEVGAGTGYNAALLGHVVGASGRVVSIDIDSDIVATARTHVSRTGLTNVRVVAADGAHGFPPEAPYDRITVTVGVREPFPAWVAQLLSHIGRWETMGSVTLSDCRITIEAGSSGVASRDRRSRPGTVVGNAYDMVVRFAGMNGAGLH